MERDQVVEDDLVAAPLVHHLDELRRLLHGALHQDVVEVHARPLRLRQFEPLVGKARDVVHDFVELRARAHRVVGLARGTIHRERDELQAAQQLLPELRLLHHEGRVGDHLELHAVPIEIVELLLHTRRHQRLAKRRQLHRLRVRIQLAHDLVVDVLVHHLLRRVGVEKLVAHEALQVADRRAREVDPGRHRARKRRASGLVFGGETGVGGLELGAAKGQRGELGWPGFENARIGGN
jgi:hypothetical protein